MKKTVMIRRLYDGKNTKDRKPRNIYKYFEDNEEARQNNPKLLKGWVGNWVLKRCAEIIKEDVNGIKVKC